ncbi:MAG: NAD-dependent epimerase/dehydratase family protein [Aquabacterium sp.]|nr:NAD-dependent epimerase/dehydratase family protein [Ferruginibacter sp.]
MILVTGGAGLVGSQLIRSLLSAGCRVRAIFNKTPLPFFNEGQVEQYPCSILDVVGLEEVMQGVDEVYHCAAIVSYDPARKHELFTINVEGTINVVNAALNTGVKKLVHVSSVAALGRIKENVPVNENINWSEETSNSNYGRSKYLSELEVWRGIGEGLNAVIVNPVIILGDGDWNSGSSQIFKSMYNEFPWYTEGISGFVDVRDVAGAMIGLMQSNISSERFIISAENRSYHEIFDLIADGFGKKKPAKKVTPFIAAMVWRLEGLKKIFTGKSPLLTKETAAAAQASVTFDNKKLLQFLPGFKYRSIEETIEYTCGMMEKKLGAIL